MKVSDIMLDLATGDASMHDAYIQEAMGQVKVSSALYDAGLAIAEADDSERESFVQEAADAGLPIDREGAITLINEAVERELIGTSRHIYSESAKGSSMISKDTSPIKAINALGQHYGVKGSLKDVKAYAAAVATAAVPKGKLSVHKVIKAGAAKKATANLIQAYVLAANAFGISTEDVKNCPICSTVTSSIASATPRKDADGKADCSLSYITDTLKHATKYTSKGITESDFTTEASKADIAGLITCYYAYGQISKNIKSKFGEDGAKVEARIRKAVKAASGKVSSAAGELNEKGGDNTSLIVDFNKGLHDLAEQLLAAFNDSISSIMEAKNTSEE